MTRRRGLGFILTFIENDAQPFRRDAPFFYFL